MHIVIYQAFRLDVAQGPMNGAPNQGVLVELFNCYYTKV